MASENLESLSKILIESIEAVQSSLPDADLLKPPDNGISLLDTKNNLLLSYLQNLVFLMVLQLRNCRNVLGGSAKDVAAQKNDSIQEEVIKKLIELRVYLEKGVKPLEGRLRYQIEKVVRAAEDADRNKSAPGSKQSKKAQRSKSSGRSPDANGDISSVSNESDSGEDSEDVDPLAYRPNPAAFVRPESSMNGRTSRSADAPPGVYRPPRIAPTIMPENGPTRTERTAARPQKSATIDDFIAAELSTAPMAEPSIGTTIRQGGRRTVGTREKQEAREREAYEEAHFVRLPKESKAERRKKGMGRVQTNGWGGEDWRELGKGADRVTGALGKGRASGNGSRVREALQRSRKRDHDSSEARSGGARIGEAFERSKRNLAEGGKKRRLR